MRIAVIIVRVLIGLLFLFASVAYFVFPQPEIKGDVKLYNDGLALVHTLTIVKVIELLCGLAFVSGYFVPLALVLIAPIAVNILLFHAVLAPEGLPVAIPLFLGLLFLAYANRESYKPLFVAK